MSKTGAPNLWNYLGRFAIVFVLSYAVVAVLFLGVQNQLSEDYRIALELYEPFRPAALSTLIPLVVRALILALILYPFYGVIMQNRFGGLILFGALWGAALFGSVEPMPGSLEGMIYTSISFTEHALVLVAIALQMLLFVWLFLKWEVGTTHSSTLENHTPGTIPGPGTRLFKGYMARFTVVHVVTYWVVGSVFYQIADYEEALAAMEIFELWRPLESLTMVLVVFLGQVVRGPVLAVLLLPFLNIYISQRYGWLYLFMLMFGLTALGSPVFLHELLVIETTLSDYLQDLWIGIPEIFTQMLLFSVLFFYWQKRNTPT